MCVCMCVCMCMCMCVCVCVCVYVCVCVTFLSNGMTHRSIACIYSGVMVAELLTKMCNCRYIEMGFQDCMLQDVLHGEVFETGTLLKVALEYNQHAYMSS